MSFQKTLYKFDIQEQTQNLISLSVWTGGI